LAAISKVSVFGADNECAMQDIAFGFKSTGLFQVRSIEGCAAAARQIEEHVYAELMQAAQGHVDVFEDLLHMRPPGEPHVWCPELSTCMMVILLT